MKRLVALVVISLAAVSTGAISACASKSDSGNPGPRTIGESPPTDQLASPNHDLTATGDEPRLKEPPAREPIVSRANLVDIALGNLERALRGVFNAGFYLADSATIADSVGQLSGDESICAARPCANGVCPPMECTTTQSGFTQQDLRNSRDNVDEGIGDLMGELRNTIFADSNFEIEDATSVTYLLRAETFCSGSDDIQLIPEPGQPQVPVAELSNCEADAQRWLPRLRLTSPRAGDVDVSVLLTDQRNRVAIVELYQSSAALDVDLGQVVAAAAVNGADHGDLVSLRGLVRLEIRREAELDYSVLSGVLQDIQVLVNGRDNQQVEVSVAASNPSTGVRLNGTTRTLNGYLHLGAVSVAGPANLFRLFDESDSGESAAPIGEIPPAPAPEIVYTGSMEFLLAGLDANVDYDVSQDRFSFTDLGLGEISSRISLDGSPLAVLDVNAAHGRRFDLGVDADDTGAQLTFSPTLDVQLVANFQPLADQGAEVPAALLQDTFRLSFEGENPSVRIEEDQFRVVNGTLNLTSMSQPDGNVSVAAGRCLIGQSDPDPPPIATPVATGDVAQQQPPATEESTFGGLHGAACR